MHPHEPESSGPSYALTAQTQSLLSPLNQAQRREVLVYLLLGALILLLAVSTVVAYQYSLPQTQWVTLGKVTQFPPNQPRPVAVDQANVWVVNTGQEFLVLNAIPNDSTRCRVVWEATSHAERQWYVDPCRATRYTIFGLYANSGPPPYRSLDRYPVRVESNGDLVIDTTAPIAGLDLESVPEACKIPHETKLWLKPWEQVSLPTLDWLHACNTSWSGRE